jgi:hypothetical protein
MATVSITQTSEERIHAAQMEDKHEEFMASQRGRHIKKENTVTEQPIEQGLTIRNDAHSIIQGVDDAMALAGHLLKSGMLPKAITTPEAALVIILTAREIGIGPMMAFQKINVIQGKPTIAPELMLALARGRGLLEDMKISNDGNKCTVTIKRKGNSPVTTSFSMDDARAQGLADKDNWKRMPSIMLQWRAIAASCRIVFPDVIGGLYTPEELGAVVDEQGEVIEGQVTEIPQSAQPEQPIQSTGSKWPREMVETVANLAETKHDKEAVSILNLSCLQPTDTKLQVVTYTNLYLFHRWKDFKNRVPAMEAKEASIKATEDYQAKKVPGAAG